MPDLWTPKLDAYLDGELTASELRDLDAHVRNCSECAADALNRVHLKRALQSRATRYPAPESLRSRVQHQIAASVPPARRAWWPVMAAALTLLVLASLFSYRSRRTGSPEREISEIADLHIATLASSNPVDVVSTDRHTVKPWFQGKIPFTFNLPELTNSDFVLLGGRVAYLRQTPGAELIYQQRKHDISVFIFPESADGTGISAIPGPQKQLSFNFETWSHDGLRYFIIGDANGEDIRRLGDLLKAAAGY